MLIPEGERPGPFPVPQSAIDEANRKARLAPQLMLQAPAVQTPSPAPTLNFAGLGDVSFDGFLWIPPDTMGAVGPNHLVVTLNNGVLVQTRTGSTAKNGVGLSAFWGRSPSGGTQAFDPRVLYDPFLDRWIFVSVASPASTGSVLLIAMSQTNDPTGNWTTYSFPADQTAAKNSQTPTLWGDYPSVGFNSKWVVVTLNMFLISNNTFSKTTIFAFDKNGLFTGAMTLGTTVFDDANAFTLSPAVTLDNTLGTIYLVESLNGNSGGFGFLRINSISGAVGSETYHASGPTPSTSNTWASFPATENFAPQLNGDANHLIDTDDDRMGNVVYRNGSLWTTQTVFLPASNPNRASVQWWQLSTTGTVQQIGRVDDSAGTNFYAYPSIAVNKNSDLLLGFSHYSASIFAEADYALAPSSGSANTLDSPATLKAGQAFYYIDFGAGRNRWGDYSATLVDPVNDLDFWTLEEFASSNNLCSTQTASCTGGWGTWWGKITAPSAAAKKRPGQVTTF